MKKIKLAVIADNFAGWSGGRDFLLSLIISLNHQKEGEDSQLETFIFFKKKLIYKKFLSEIDLLIKNFFRIITGKKIKSSEAIKNKHIYKNYLSAINNLNANQTIYYTNKKNLKNILEKTGYDLLFSSFPAVNTNIAKVFYYPDLQYKFLPEFFSPKEIDSRDQNLTELTKEKNIIITHSISVKKDIDKFFPENKCNIFGLPLAPILFDNSWLDDLGEEVLKKYNLLNRKYFLISNQFWIHKSHITAFEALSKLHQSKEFEDIWIVCTGSTFDYRFPNYFEELMKQVKDLNIENKIIILGMIPKREQIEIMKKSIALIQPTLFEGSIGGLAFYDALSVGVPAIISNIEVNLNAQNEQNSFYFQVKNADDLKDKMINIIGNPPIRPTKNELIENNKKRIMNLRAKLIEAFLLATKHE